VRKTTDANEPWKGFELARNENKKSPCITRYQIATSMQNIRHLHFAPTKAGTGSLAKFYGVHFDKDTFKKKIMAKTILLHDHAIARK